MVTVYLMIPMIAFSKAIFSRAQKWLLKCAFQPAVRKNFLTLVYNGTLNAIVESSQHMDLIGPGWTNVMQNVPVTRIKYVEDQEQCPCIRPRVSIKWTAGWSHSFQSRLFVKIALKCFNFAMTDLPKFILVKLINKKNQKAKIFGHICTCFGQAKFTQFCFSEKKSTYWI